MQSPSSLARAGGLKFGVYREQCKRKVDLEFTELRAWLEEKGLDKGIDDQSLLNGIDTWLQANRISLFDIN